VEHAIQNDILLIQCEDEAGLLLMIIHACCFHDFV
jgi:hypothetical protein